MFKQKKLGPTCRQSTTMLCIIMDYAHCGISIIVGSITSIWKCRAQSQELGLTCSANSLAGRPRKYQPEVRSRCGSFRKIKECYLSHFFCFHDFSNIISISNLTNMRPDVAPQYNVCVSLTKNKHKF